MPRKEYEKAAIALDKAAIAAERGDSKGTRRWLAVAEEWRLLGNDSRGHEVGYLRRNH